MSGSNLSDRGSGAVAERAAPLVLAVHAMQPPSLDEAQRRTASGRLRMFMVLLVCAAPVVASYVMYYVVRPAARTNYSTLIEPQRPMPADLSLTGLDGAPVKTSSLKGQWLLVVVAGGACDAACERQLWVQRQLREALGRDKERVDKVWLITDGVAPRAKALEAITTHTTVTVLQVSKAALETWLQPALGHVLESSMYIVDPLGNWMMRVPPDPEPAKLKRDLDKLMRGSAGWDKPGR